MSKLNARFFGAVALQFVLLLGVIGFKQYTVITGETVRLQTVPVDPRSLFQGDYVALRYDITTLDVTKLDGDDYFGPRDQVHVALQVTDGIAQPIGAYRDRHDVPSGAIYITGKVDDSDARFPLPGSGGPPPLRVTYGIENLFVQEDTGKRIERTPAERVTVEVKVDRWGNAVLRQLYIDGEAFKAK